MRLRPITFALFAGLQRTFGALPILFQQQDFNAASFAQAVNHYIAMGEKEAIRSLASTARTSMQDLSEHHGTWSTNERIGWICRVVFEPVGAASIRPPYFGGLNLPERTMPASSWPRFPIARVGSTHFVLSEGYSLFGVAENPGAYIEYCRKHGTFRQTKIPVPTRAQALQDAAALRNSRAWGLIKWKDGGQNWGYSLSEPGAWDFIESQAEKIR